MLLSNYTQFNDTPNKFQTLVEFGILQLPRFNVEKLHQLRNLLLFFFNENTNAKIKT